MLRCRNCGETSDTVRYSGVVLIAEGVAGIDSSGRIISLGPARATMTVRIGEEFKAATTQFICDRCNTVGDMNAFEVVRVCPFTKEVATERVVTEIGTELYVAPRAVEMARQVFSTERADWRKQVQEGDLH